MVERSVEAVYTSAAQAVLVTRHPDPGVVVATGKDRLDLLHRMSTNDIAGMPAGTIRQSVLTNPIGRVVDVLRILALEDETFLLTSSGRAETVRKWLQGYIFFQDDVQLSIAPLSWSEWGIYGPRSGEEVSSAFADLTLPAGEGLVQLDGGFIWHMDNPGRGGFHLLLAPEQTQNASEIWRGRGGETVDAAAYQILRIEAGLPEPVHEIKDESISLEVGLRDSISFTKGCYIGQEIIARMDSRGRQAHMLVGVRLSDRARPGDVVYQDGRDVGSLTSVARSPSLGWIALASVRPNVLDVDEGRVQIGMQRSPAGTTRLPLTNVTAEAEASEPIGHR